MTSCLLQTKPLLCSQGANPFFIDRYKIKRQNRYDNDPNVSGKGGGVLFYVADHINYVRRNNLESSDIESIWLEIKLKNNKHF